MNPLRQLLLKNQWHDKKNLIIEYIHRGAHNNMACIESKNIKSLLKQNFIFLGEKGITYIPYHRIVRVKEKDQILYEKTSIEAKSM